MRINKKAEWQKVMLRDLCSKVQYGYTEKSSTVPIGPRFLRITDIVPETINWEEVPYCVIPEEKYELYFLKQGDIVIARTGATTGYAKYLKNVPHSVFASYLVRLQIAEDVESRYIGFIVESDDYKDFIKKNIGGSAQPNANAQILTSYIINLPNIFTQKKIAAILSAYDDLIDNYLRRIKILEEMAQNLYREWFVNFRFPGHEQVRFVDSPLGRIPEGWEVVSFTDIAEVLSGGTPKTTIPEYWNGNIPFFAPKDATAYFFVTETNKYITEIGLNKCNSKLYPSETIFITARGTVGKVILAAVNMAMNQSCYALKGKPGISQKYLFFTTLEQVEYLKKNTGGATFDTIVVDTFHRMQVIKPTIELINRFTKTVDPFVGHILNLINKNMFLRQTRDLLLPKLISGELDVSELEITLPEEVAS